MAGRRGLYIILDRERDVFLSLETIEERRHFIEAFWKKRDPNPATPENEFRVEHYRRIDYANQFLGRETYLPGWKTDRGRMYIILGEPIEIQRFDDYGDILPAHLWFYQGDPSKGLPSFFYLMFYKRNDVGEYRLYRPVVDGPNELVRGFAGQGAQATQALPVLRDVSQELARASLSLDPSEPPDFETARPSLGSEAMLARIYDSPKRAIRTDYADAWLEYGDRVSAEYSFNFVPSRSFFAVLNGPDATPFVHYSVEIDPRNFSMEADEDQTKIYTTLDVSVEARDKEGDLVLANQREAYIELTPGQLEQVKASPFAYQADFPLLPGEYKLSVILRNRVLAQYTVAERDIVVRSIPTAAPAISDIVLGYSVETMRGATASGQELRAFQIGDARVHPAADGAFALGETVHLFLQVQGAGPDHRLEIAFLNGEEVLDERTTEMSSYLGGAGDRTLSPSGHGRRTLPVSRAACLSFRRGSGREGSRLPGLTPCRSRPTLGQSHQLQYRKRRSAGACARGPVAGQEALRGSRCGVRAGRRGERRGTSRRSLEAGSRSRSRRVKPIERSSSSNLWSRALRISSRSWRAWDSPIA